MECDEEPLLQANLLQPAEAHSMPSLEGHLP